MPYLRACLLCCLGGAGRGDEVAWVRWRGAFESCRLEELIPAPIRAGVGKVFAAGDYLLSTIANSFYEPTDVPWVVSPAWEGGQRPPSDSMARAMTAAGER
jgi:hypothetical protein